MKRSLWNYLVVTFWWLGVWLDGFSLGRSFFFVLPGSVAGVARREWPKMSVNHGDLHDLSDKKYPRCWKKTSRYIVCKIKCLYYIMYANTRWFNSWPFLIPSIEVTNNHLKGVTFSPSQKGHHRNCQVIVFFVDFGGSFVDNDFIVNIFIHIIYN